jgi:aryl-alcohol dehydrogenase-like predicted oxidoreductase
MNYRLLGTSGLRVSELCLGTMTFGEEWGWGASKEESRRIFDAYAAAGGNFIDTANRYTEGTSERFVGEFVAAERERFVVATKYTLFTRKGDPNSAGNHRKNLVQSLEASLKRLKLDCVDLYWVHAWDYLTPADEVMRALDDVVRAGKALYVGISDTPAWIVSRANLLAELRGWTPFAGIQIEYSLIQRTVERELLPMARALDLAVCAWGPIGGGVLSGKYNPDASPAQRAEPGRLRENPAAARLAERNLRIADTVREVARETGHTPAQIAVNWVRHQPGKIIPIVGARTLAQIEDTLGAVGFELTPGQLSRLDEASRIELGFPHEFLLQPNIRDLVYGGTWDQILDRRP